MYKALIEKRIKQNGVKFGSYGSDPDDPQSSHRGRGGFNRGRGRGHFGGMGFPGPFCEDEFGPPGPMMMGGFCDDGPGFGGPGPEFGDPGFWPDGGAPMGPGPWRGRGRARGGHGPYPGPMRGGPGPMGPMRGGFGPMGPMGSMGEGPGPMGGPGMRGRGGNRGRGGFLYNCDMPLGFGNFDEQGFGNFDDPSFAADMDPSDEQGEGYNPFQMLASASNRGGPASFGRGGVPARGWGRGGALAKPKTATPAPGNVMTAGEESRGAEASEEKVENPILEAAGQEGFEDFKKGWGSAFAKTNPDAEFYVSTELKKFRYNNELNALRGGRGGMLGRGGMGMGRGGKRMAKKNDVELEPFNQVPPPREPTPEPQHPEEEVEKYFKKVLRDRPPGAWVNEMAKQKHWFVHGVESSRMIGKFRRSFDFTLTIHDMVVIGKGPKKKDAKNDAYKKMAIKFGEYFCYLPILKKPEKEKPKEEGSAKEEKEVKEEKPKPMASAAAEVTTAGGVKVINSILETKALQTAYDTSLTAAVDHRMVPEPEEIRTISSKDMATIQGHPVIVLSDTCKKLHYKTPQYACVREEKVGKIGIYWKLEYTMRVALTRGLETKVYYGKSITKKEAKNQAAAAAYFGVTGLSDVMGPVKSRSSLQTLVESTEKIKSSVKESIEQASGDGGGTRIAVLGSAVPLPAPSTLSVPAPSSSFSTADASLDDPATKATVTDQVNMMIKDRNEKLKEEKVREDPKEGSSGKTDLLKSSSRSKKDGTLDDELDKFENFLSDLESDVKKEKEKSKKSKKRSRSRSRSRHKSSSKRKSPSPDRSYDNRKYYSSSRDRSRSRERDRHYDYDRDRDRDRDRRGYEDRRSSYSRRSRSRSSERHVGSRYYDDYYNDYDKSKGYEDRRRRDYY